MARAIASASPITELPAGSHCAFADLVANAASNAASSMAADAAAAAVAATGAPRRVYVVDDDVAMRKSLVFLLAGAGYAPRAYDGGDAFLAAAPALPPGCVLTDVRMPGLDGEQVAGALGNRLGELPVIVMTGHGDVAMAVRLMRSGASDFLEKPFEGSALLASLAATFAGLEARTDALARSAAARDRLAALTVREAAVLERLADGHANKMIAWQLSLSVRTVEMYRAQMMERLDVRSLPEALQLLHDAGQLQRPR